MYISKMHHFLDETGNIPKNMHKSARELAGFHALVVDETTKNHLSGKTSTEIRCFKKKCNGIISSKIYEEDMVIYWYCDTCDNAGEISEWQGTRWDNR